VNAVFHRRRKSVVWLFAIAMLLLGLGAQLHGLWHSLQAVHTSTDKDALAAHPQACEQCVLYAALDGGPPCSVGPLLPLPSAAPECSAAATRPRPSVFTAYISRAPPKVA